MPGSQQGGRRVAAKEATARIKINKLLEAVGWRFFEENGEQARYADGR